LNERVLDNARNVRRCLEMVEEIAIQINEAIESYRNFKRDKKVCMDAVNLEVTNRELQYGVIEKQMAGIQKAAREMEDMRESFEETRATVVENSSTITDITKNIEQLKNDVTKEFAKKISTSGGTIYGDLTVTGMVNGRAEKAKEAESVEWDAVQNRPEYYPPAQHNHDDLYPAINGERAEGKWNIDISGKADKAGDADRADNADHAAVADKIDWAGIENKPENYPPAEHNHDALYPSIKGERAEGVWNIDIDGEAKRAKSDSEGNIITATYVKKTDMGELQKEIGKISTEIKESLKGTSVENETPDEKITLRCEVENGMLTVVPYVNGERAYITSSVIACEDTSEE